MFVVPPFESATTLVLYYGAVFLLYDTLYTVVNVPYLALIPELAQDYDQRSSLTGWRTAFSFLAQLVTAGAFKLLAENLFTPWFGVGPEALRMGYLLAAGLWAVSMALPVGPDLARQLALSVSVSSAAPRCNDGHRQIFAGSWIQGNRSNLARP